MARRPARLGAGRRTALAGALVVVGLAGPLTAWFVAGWARARQEADEALRRPGAHAAEAARDLAARLGERLEALRERESQRPFYHYQNLYHDPRGASAGWSVVPSPLASGTGDALVRGHFQIDPTGQVTLPMLNDEVPEVVSGDLRASGEALRRELTPVRAQLVDAAPLQTDARVVAALQPELESPEGGPERPSKAHRPPSTDPDTSSGGAADSDVGTDSPPTVGAESVRTVPIERQQEVAEIDWEAYSQNRSANQIYQTVRNLPRTNVRSFPQPTLTGSWPKPSPTPSPTATVETATLADSTVKLPDAVDVPPDAAQVATPTAPKKPRRTAALRGHDKGARLPARIIITTDPLHWHAVSIGGVPTLVALRQVGTPDGRLTQGFVVSQAALDQWVREQGVDGAGVVAGAADARAAAGGAQLPVLGGAFDLVVAPARQEVVAAREQAHAARIRFYRQFFPIGGLAALLGALVVLVVARSERDARQRSLFAASAAHELRTPLAGLAMYGEMISEGLGDPKRTGDYARRMSNEAARLGRVVGNVLGFTQLERGALKVRPRAGDLVACVEAAVERARPALTAAGAELELEVHELPEIAFDADAVAQILHNLIDNAEKYTRDAKDRHVRVVVEPGGPGATITVIDHGPGLPASARRLFRPFQRAASADAPAGLGLGLALCRALAREQGGDLTASAGPGGRFTLTLPKA